MERGGGMSATISFFYRYNIPIIEVIDIVEIAEKEIELVQNDERHLRHKQKIFFSHFFCFLFVDLFTFIKL